MRGPAGFIVAEMGEIAATKEGPTKASSIGRIFAAIRGFGGNLRRRRILIGRMRSPMPIDIPNVRREPGRADGRYRIPH